MKYDKTTAWLRVISLMELAGIGYRLLMDSKDIGAAGIDLLGSPISRDAFVRDYLG